MVDSNRMIDYFLNCMGPVNQDWITKYGEHWSAGRIDVHDDTPFGIEYPVPPMRSEDWKAFGSWLYEMQTEEVWSYEKLLEHFQYWYGKEITWWEA